jgi:hypothetical protein
MKHLILMLIFTLFGGLTSVHAQVNDSVSVVVVQPQEQIDEVNLYLDYQSRKLKISATSFIIAGLVASAPAVFEGVDNQPVVAASALFTGVGLVTFFEALDRSRFKKKRKR